MEGIGEHAGGTPEEREGLSIQAIVIPADMETAVRADQFGPSSLREYQRAVGGLIEQVTLTDPAASLFVNEEGKLLDLPLNRRATLLLWMHNPAFRYAELVVGDALLVGPPDDEGQDTGVPDDLAHVLLEAKRFRAEVQTDGESGWHGNDRRFDNWYEAYSYVLNLGSRWTSVTDVRVVPEA